MGKKDVRFSVDIPEDLHKKIKILSAERDTTMRKIFIECLNDYVEKSKEVAGTVPR